MSVVLVLFSFLALSAFAFPDKKFIGSYLDNHDFRAPGPGDARSPCPGWNVLANHGYINRNGKNVTYESFLAAVTRVLGVPPSVTVFAAVNAQIAAKVFPNGVLASLDVLSATHNVIEHDASLSREDLYLGNNYLVSPQLVNQLIPDLDGTVTRSNIVAHRSNRIKDSKARNPTFTWNLANQRSISAGESAFLDTILGQGQGVIPARQLYQFLKEERLPTGWTKRNVTLLEFSGVTAYYLAREVVANSNSAMTEEQAMDYAQKAVKRSMEEANK